MNKVIIDMNTFQWTMNDNWHSSFKAYWPKNEVKAYKIRDTFGYTRDIWHKGWLACEANYAPTLHEVAQLQARVAELEECINKLQSDLCDELQANWELRNAL